MDRRAEHSRAHRRERVLASPQYRDGRFRNPSGAGPGLRKGTTGSVVKGYLRAGARRSPSEPLPANDPREAWLRAPETGLRATWLGHSTLLLEVDGVRVLTDPVWGQRVSPSSLVGPKRFQPVPVAVEDLPAIDAVVISHDHYDHLDRPTIARLLARDVPFYTSLGVGGRLEGWGVPTDRIHELDWWESAEIVAHDRRGSVELTAVPCQHFSGRGVSDGNSTLWSSLVLRGPRHRVFFSGDTGLTDGYREIAARMGPFDLVMLEVGAFHPAWGDIHLGPDNALTALEMLGGGPLLPIHWGTFNLALHDWDDPAERLVEQAPLRGADLLMPMLGAPVEPSRPDLLTPWWRAVSAREKRRRAETRGGATAEVVELPISDPVD
jgi:L-ascorbate metabolism protein UlaG (beta-lactamase superfamily)